MRLLFYSPIISSSYCPVKTKEVNLPSLNKTVRSLLCCRQFINTSILTSTKDPFGKMYAEMSVHDRGTDLFTCTGEFQLTLLAKQTWCAKRREPSDIPVFILINQDVNAAV